MRAASKTEPLDTAPRRTRARVRPAAAAPDSPPADSPALSLQADLSARWEMEAEGEYRGPRWSPRRMLAVSGGVSLMLWVVIGLAVRAFVTP